MFLIRHKIFLSTIPYDFLLMVIKGKMVLVELVPTFSFAMCFMWARILATPALWNFVGWPLSLTHNIHAAAAWWSVLSMCEGLTAGQGLELYFSGVIRWVDNLHFRLY